MSLGGALNAAVSALQAQGQVLSTVSTNISNADTVGYKDVSSGFQTLVTQQATPSYYPPGGVSVSPVQNVTTQGQVSQTGVSTNMALIGNGMFVVAPGITTAERGFTRQGQFAPDSSGYLSNNGQYLMGWPTDSTGSVTAGADTTSTAGLKPINIFSAASTASATTSVSLQYNMPADATVGYSQTTSIQIFDSLGATQNVPATWTKAATNSWTLSLGNPVSPTSSTTQTGTIGGTTSYTVAFNADGTPSSSTQPVITVSTWNDGASSGSSHTVALNLGTANTSSGLTQFASGKTSPTISVNSTSKDGVSYGSLLSTSVSADGTVSANYSNGLSKAIYKVAVATFKNFDGLALGAHNVYQQSNSSGDYTLHTAGDSGAASVSGGALEGSTVDTTGQFSVMILAQQAYSAAAQVVTTSNSMYTTLEQAFK